MWEIISKARLFQPLVATWNINFGDPHPLAVGILNKWIMGQLHGF